MSKDESPLYCIIKAVKLQIFNKSGKQSVK